MPSMPSSRTRGGGRSRRPSRPVSAPGVWCSSTPSCPRPTAPGAPGGASTSCSTAGPRRTGVSHHGRRGGATTASNGSSRTARTCTGPLRRRICSPLRLVDPATCAYVRLSAPYDGEADDAAARAWTVERIEGTHLDPITDPERMAAVLDAVVRRVRVRAGGWRPSAVTVAWRPWRARTAGRSWSSGGRSCRALRAQPALPAPGRRAHGGLRPPRCDRPVDRVPLHSWRFDLATGARLVRDEPSPEPWDRIANLPLRSRPRRRGVGRVHGVRRRAGAVPAWVGAGFGWVPAWVGAGVGGCRLWVGAGVGGCRLGWVPAWAGVGLGAVLPALGANGHAW